MISSVEIFPTEWLAFGEVQFLADELPPHHFGIRRQEQDASWEFDLERHYAVKLFDRRSRGVSPTYAGEELARHVRDLFSRLDHLKRTMSEFSLGARADRSEFMPMPRYSWKRSSRRS